MVSVLPLAFGGVAALLGVLILLTAVGRLRSWNTLRGSSAGGVLEAGMAEVEGRVEPLHETLDPPQAETETVVYDYEKEKYRPDPNNERADDWTTAETDEGRVPFVLAGGARDVVVDPEGADLVLTEEREKANGVRHKSSRLDIGESGYAAGTVVPAQESTVDTDGHQYVLGSDDTPLEGSLGGLVGSPFVLSDKGEDQAESQLLRGGLAAFVVGIIVTGLGSVFLLIGIGG